MKQLKYKPCKVCKTMFKPFSSLARVCSPQCALKLVRSDKEKAFKRETRALRKKLKTKGQWVKDCQSNAFNPYIRARDTGNPCISCGRYDWEITERLTGGKWDCGHYLTIGAHPELRFHPLNAHRQCKSCNGGSGRFTSKNSTVAKQYRLNLINKIGLGMVEWLEGKQEAQHLCIEDLQEIKQYYKDQTKLLKE